VPASTRGSVLLVDDEELVRLSTADMLTDPGYAVIEAASAEEALKLVNQGEHFDLLVTDHLMPGMNGKDLARTVRRHIAVYPYSWSRATQTSIPSSLLSTPD
jgi:CheY-like chemotaxis protein